MNPLIVSSPVFVEDGLIPEEYTCQGVGVNPPLVIDNIPESTLTMALIVEDPDAPKGTVTHWIAWDILPEGSISENSNPGVNGLNTKGQLGWMPPCPPSGQHRYFFHVYALDASLNLSPGSGREELEKALQGHIIARGTLMGRYGKVLAGEFEQPR